MDHGAGITVLTQGTAPRKDEQMTQPTGMNRAGAGSVLGFQRLRKGSSAGMTGWDPKGCLGSGVTTTFLSHIPEPHCLLRQTMGGPCPPPSSMREPNGPHIDMLVHTPHTTRPHGDLGEGRPPMCF